MKTAVLAWAVLLAGCAVDGGPEPEERAAEGTTCSTATAWVAGKWYRAGAVVKYTDGKHYVAEHGNPGYVPTISTWYWDPKSCGVVVTPPPTATPTPTTPPPPTAGLPAKVVAGYYPDWPESAIRVRDVNANYNVIYLFAARPVGGAPGTTGAVAWSPPGNGRGAATNFNADVQYARKEQGRKIILSIGGAGNGMTFPSRTKSQTFVESVVGLYDKFGGFDGIDWNTFEADQAPDTAEMKWISLELKRRYPGFLVTAPPAPWSARDKAFCAEMVRDGAMDYVAPQYYDGPGLDQQSYIVKNVKEWIALVGASKVVVGFGIWDQPNYMSIGEAVPTWNELEAANPTIRGAFDWAIHLDESQGWPFATKLGPIVRY